MIIVVILFAILVWLIAKLVKGMKKHPDEHTQLQTQKSVQEVADIVRQFAAEQEAEIGKIEEDPLGNFGTDYDIAVFLHGLTHAMVQTDWAVQVYAKGTETGTDVELIALAQSADLYSGGLSIEHGREKSQILAGRLR